MEFFGFYLGTVGIKAQEQDKLDLGKWTSKESSSNSFCNSTQIKQVNKIKEHKKINMVWYLQSTSTT